MAEVAWIRIYSGVLVCTCGHETMIVDPSSRSPIEARPYQECEKCKTIWWAMGTAECEALSEKDQDDARWRFNS